jgi:integrase
VPGHVYKRGNIYWITFHHNGKKLRHSAKTDKKREAERLLSFYLGQVARGEFKGFEPPQENLTLFAMLDDFIEDYEQRGMRDIQITRYRAKHLRTFFKDVPVEYITEHKIGLYIRHRLKQGRTRTTVNRELQLLGQAMRLARSNKRLKEVPQIKKFSENDNARQGFFEQHEMEAIVSFLPPYLQDLTRFAYYTGWRKNEMLTLEWQDIQGDVIRLKPTIAKNKEGRIIILMGEIANIIARRRAERVQFCPYVFHRDGQRIKHYNRAWRTAREKAGLPDKIMHDARRTAVRNMDRAGVPRQVAKQITGHKTDAVYNRYRIVNEQDIREGMAKVFQSHSGHSAPAEDPPQHDISH